jgi:hypothetical protein
MQGHVRRTLLVLRWMTFLGVIGLGLLCFHYKTLLGFIVRHGTSTTKTDWFLCINVVMCHISPEFHLWLLRMVSGVTSTLEPPLVDTSARSTLLWHKTSVPNGSFPFNLTSVIRTLLHILFLACAHVHEHEKSFVSEKVCCTSTQASTRPSLHKETCRCFPLGTR